jgi:EAL domain-containing protein (putative c-di-GMP-specific phosphodiesterase class I)
VGGRASSYQYLSRLPVEYLVIDPMLLRLAAESARAEAVLAGIVHTAGTLGQTTIAKQIEDEASAARAAALGITWGQGFLFGEPSTPARAG